MELFESFKSLQQIIIARIIKKICCRKLMLPVLCSYLYQCRICHEDFAKDFCLAQLNYCELNPYFEIAAPLFLCSTPIRLLVCRVQMHDAELTSVTVFGSPDDEDGWRCLSVDATGCMHVWKVLSGDAVLVLNRTHVPSVPSVPPLPSAPPFAAPGSRGSPLLPPRIIHNDLVLSVLSPHTYFSFSFLILEFLIFSSFIFLILRFPHFCELLVFDP